MLKFHNRYERFILRAKAISTCGCAMKDFQFFSVNTCVDKTKQSGHL